MQLPDARSAIPPVVVARETDWQALAALHAASAALHAAQAARLAERLDQDAADLLALRASVSWRLTWPLRAATVPVRAVLRPRRAWAAARRAWSRHRAGARLLRVLREEGVRVTLDKSLRLSGNLARHAMRAVGVRLAVVPARLSHLGRVLEVAGSRMRHRLADRSAALPAPPAGPFAAPAAAPLAAPASRVIADHAPARILAPSVLIVGELSLPQCAKYRVWQKREQLLSLGVGCTVRDWTDLDAARDALQLCAMVVFYRVPGHPGVLALYDEARRLGLEVIWEVDDLIFDAALYLADRDLGRLDPGIRRGVLAGAALYDRALRGADRGIASTAALAEPMRARGPAIVDVIDNALDADTLRIADGLLAAPPPRDPDVVRILYGSGSRTHDGDFAVATPALVEILRRLPHVRLRIVGELDVPDALRRFGDRVDHLPARDYPGYLAVLAAADINIAPLEDTPFNGAKSNIKFVEAGILGIASVCSPSPNFAAAIRDGVDGHLAADTAGWIAALNLLATDADHRTRIGTAARAAVLDRYAPARVAAAQLAPLVAPMRGAWARAGDGRLRVLAAHRHLYPPRSDGRTRLARQDIEALAARGDADCAVFTTEDLAEAAPYALRRLAGRAVPVFAMRPPRREDPLLALDDPRAARRFAEVLVATAPDLVWLGDLRGLGAGLARACLERGTPYAIDLAASWWREPGTIGAEAKAPTALLRAVIGGALRHAALLVAPNAAVAAGAVAAGGRPERVRILPPGIPAAPASPPPSGPALVFGYAGTDEGRLLRDCFADWPQADAALVLIDHARAEGRIGLHAPHGGTGACCDIRAPFDAAGREAFLAAIDVLVYPGRDPLATAQIAREALARGVWVMAPDEIELPAAPTLTRLGPGTDDPAMLRAELAALLPRRDAIRAARLAPPQPQPQPQLPQPPGGLDVDGRAGRLRALLGACRTQALC